MNNNKFKIKLSIKITNQNTGEHIFGDGILMLLEKIRDTGSIKKAAKEMRLSYSKAWKIIKRLENQTSAKVLEVYKGGKLRGGAKLTNIAENLINDYKKYYNNIYNYSQKLYPKSFKKIFN